MSAPWTADDVRGLVTRGRSEWRAAVLAELDLSGVRIEAACFEDACLRRASLRGAWLPGARLAGADLRGADLRAAALMGADLRGADLRRADLREADLGDADLHRADLRFCDLRGARLDGAAISLGCDTFLGVRADERAVRALLGLLATTRVEPELRALLTAEGQPVPLAREVR